ncbi:MAG TPA: Dickkopf N-terminal cysteine-rich domain-containing protein, partial [Polyangiales bacterium]|nr:Dickkopf N-terminal cysteine-rich domain-containing protein [Polyangiales bacterium]
NANCKPTGMVTDPVVAGAALASCTGITTTACLPKSLLGAWTCAPHNAAGGTCITDNNCNDGLYCNNPQSTIGKCAARLAVGAACSAPNSCASLFCKSDHCVAADQQAAYCLATN